MATKKIKKLINLENSLDKYYEVTCEARKHCKEFLLWALKKYGNKDVDQNGRVKFTLEFDPSYDYEIINIMYDGGGHPEYASNCFSEVYSVTLSNGDLSVYIEDSSNYEFDRIAIEDLLTICSVIKDSVIPRILEDEE
jgi:hypothetical protein